jgi:hypothetical protein
LRSERPTDGKKRPGFASSAGSSHVALVLIFAVAAVVARPPALDVPPARKLAALAATKGCYGSHGQGRVRSFAGSLSSGSAREGGRLRCSRTPGADALNADVDVDPVRLVQELRSEKRTFTLIFPVIRAEEQAEIVADATTEDPRSWTFTPRASATRPRSRAPAGPGARAAAHRNRLGALARASRRRSKPISVNCTAD